MLIKVARFSGKELCDVQEGRRWQYAYKGMHIHLGIILKLHAFQGLQGFWSQYYSSF
jgi:hypothetical protein